MAFVAGCFRAAVQRVGAVYDLFFLVAGYPEVTRLEVYSCMCCNNPRMVVA
jgi:hypothetical protein